MASVRKQTPESALLRLCLEYLAAEHILAFRMNTGAVKIDKRLVRFGTPGMADILAFPRKRYPDGVHRTWKIPMPTWIECKALGGVQTDLQKSFQEQVEAEGHRYCIIRSLDDLVEALA